MNTIKKYITIFIISLSIYYLFKYNYELKVIINTSINIWINNVFPSFFFMFIFSYILISLNIFKNKSIEIFLLSIISGMPSSSYMIINELENNIIDEKTSNTLIKCTYFLNPLFLYTILSNTFNKDIVIKIIISHYLANVIVFIFTYKKGEIVNNYKNINILSITMDAIKKSINTLFMILGVIILYMFIIFIINKTFNISNNINIIITGLLEITQGLNKIYYLEYPSIIKEIISLSLISFGGLSIHTQVYSFLCNSKVLYKNYLLGRIIQIILSIIIYELLQIPI